jgi:hypothetical protein
MRTGAKVVAVGVTVAAVATAGVLVLRGTPGASADAESDCAEPVTRTLSVAPAMADVARSAAAALREDCVELEVEPASSVQVARRFEFAKNVPDLWIAESNTWQAQLFGKDVQLRIVGPALASTPVVLAGGPDTVAPATWRAAFDADSVELRDPLSDGVGALAMLALRSEMTATGAGDEQIRETLVPLAQRYGEQRDGRADEASLDGLIESLDADRLMPVTEQELVHAGSETDLHARVPSKGAPLLQFPLYAPTTADAGTLAAARALTRWFASAPGLARLAKEGFRPPDGKPIAKGVGPVRSLPLPVPFAAASDLKLWQDISQPSSVLAVFDASGSMDFMAGTQSRMQLAVGVAKTALAVFPDRARIGLWVFSIDQGGPGKDWRELEPMRRLDADVNGASQRDRLDGQAEQMLQLTTGGTGLYDTTLAAYQRALRDYDPAYSNSVILMTDGANDDPGSISLDRLVRDLQKARSPKRPVRIIGIGISDDADYPALRRIAEATGGQAYSADTPEDILGVFAKAIASR